MSKATFMLGFIAGVTSVGGVSAKEPVAYLYNGVRLPKLPEWDKTAYPYAIITVSSTDVYRLSLSTQVFDYSGLAKVTTAAPTKAYKLVDGQWEWISDKESGTYTLSLISPVWSNHDVLYSDYFENDGLAGKVMIAASDPVPVYE